MSYYEETKSELEDLITDFEKAREMFDRELEKLEKRKRDIKVSESVVRQMAKERQIGFPVLAKAYEDFFKLQDRELVRFLTGKNTPAIRAGEVLAEYARIRQNAVKENKTLKYIIEYYESVAPFLVDLKEEVLDTTEEEEREIAKDYTPEELEDYVTKYITKEEYRKFTTTQKNQLALDRYWKRPKSKKHIGKVYERYVGALYEQKGYEVDYVGIFKGYEDLGRDIIAKKGKKLVVIQCKNWSKFKTIYEKHIFQFFGTVFQYKEENKNNDVKAVFYTTTKLSDLAKRFAKELKIELVENDKIPKTYPSIKCNISRVDGTKIYHLPFDQQYDKIKIEQKKGEFYCSTIEEAEEKGFRRAFKYKGLNKSKQ